ncbi:hypothetical protein N7492_000415 [Penicillium capsulatum]|uniref:MARVEL domain-containing protein n=1 Tax=Penicillium capsulatum TaxID=69766 RepID=A0A9W9LZD7_9EURO|nr:hypothetical protein N7492_000415 [Penicillium capsulatum]KAJ6130522.1 hypothetical protein N7512_003302 [Penicillium capsulatum]
MPVISRLISIPLRIAEIAFAAVVAGIVGHYLAKFSEIDPWPEARWIYTEVIAGLSILLGLLWLIPFSSSFFTWPLDVLLSLAWFAAFGLLVDTIHQIPRCNVFDWWFPGNDRSLCTRWKAAEAFSFLSAIVWLVSALVGIWFTFRSRKNNEEQPRRRWGRSRAAPAEPAA